MQRHVTFVKVQLSRVRLRTELEKEKYRSWQGTYKPYVTNKSGIFMHYNEVFNPFGIK